MPSSSSNSSSSRKYLEKINTHIINNHQELKDAEEDLSNLQSVIEQHIGARGGSAVRDAAVGKAKDMKGDAKADAKANLQTSVKTAEEGAGDGMNQGAAFVKQAAASLARGAAETVDKALETLIDSIEDLRDFGDGE